MWSYTDHASQVVRRKRRELDEKYGDGSTDDQVFFVKKVPNPKRVNPLTDP